MSSRERSSLSGEGGANTACVSAMKALLAWRRDVQIADISGHVLSRFPPLEAPLPGETSLRDRQRNPAAGHLFLSSNAGAQYGNLTRRFLFPEDCTIWKTQSPGPSDVRPHLRSTPPQTEVAGAPPCEAATPTINAVTGTPARLIRAVMIASDSISPPSDEYFSNQALNGHTLILPSRRLNRSKGGQSGSWSPNAPSWSGGGGDSTSPGNRGPGTCAAAWQPVLVRVRGVTLAPIVESDFADTGDEEEEEKEDVDGDDPHTKAKVRRRSCRQPRVDEFVARCAHRIRTEEAAFLANIEQVLQSITGLSCGRYVYGQNGIGHGGAVPGGNTDGSSSLEGTRLKAYTGSLRSLLSSSGPAAAAVTARTVDIMACKQRGDVDRAASARCGNTLPQGQATVHIMSDTLILTVPVYYIPVMMQDNQQTRLTRIAGVLKGIIDLIVDPASSCTKISTYLFEALCYVALQAEEVLVRARGDASAAEGEAPHDERQPGLKKALSAIIIRDCARFGLLKGAPRHRSSRSLGSTNELLSDSERLMCDIRLLCDLLTEWVAVLGTDSAGTLSLKLASRRHRHGTEGDELDALQVPHFGPLRMPGVLVHCQLGVSRSPSVIALYMFLTYAECLRGHGVTVGSMMDVFREVRPQVKPNFCFLAEINALWKQASGPP